jgi:hypothetical protein
VTVQLGFDFRATAERRYVCCGQPCGELGEEARPWPHADDCPNENVGVWVDRATGWPIRRLHCISADGTCPHGGRFPQRAGLADPYGGLCCLAIRRAEEGMVRVDGDAQCPACGKPYREHPWDEENLSAIDGKPYLRIGCDGRGLKL